MVNSMLYVFACFEGGGGGEGGGVRECYKNCSYFTSLLYTARPPGDSALLFNFMNEVEKPHSSAHCSSTQLIMLQKREI